MVGGRYPAPRQLAYNRHRMKPLSLLLILLPALLLAQNTTVYIGLGENAKAVEAWDGSISVSGGELVSLEDRHFLDNDKMTGPNRWSASTREEQIKGFALMNYNEMSPAELPPTQYSPFGLFATIRDGGSARVSVKTKQGNFQFRVGDLSYDATEFLEGRASAAITPAVEKLSSEEYEDDEAAIIRTSDTSVGAAWVAYKDRGDRILGRVRESGVWRDTQEITTKPGDIWRVSLASPEADKVWVFWSQRDGSSWDLWGRFWDGDAWRAPEKISADGSNTFHRASGVDGKVFVTWQSTQGAAGKAQSDIYLRVHDGQAWGDPLQVSESEANDWEPQIASGPNGQAHVVWDSYDAGNYDVFYRVYTNSKLGEIEQVTSSERFQAHANVAVDNDGTAWLAWDESGVNWGKDQGYLITPPLSAPLHQERSIKIVKRDGASWVEPKTALDPFYTYRLYPNFENPQLAFDSTGTLTMLFRHWTRQRTHSIGSRLMWETFLTRFNGKAWSTPVPINHREGSIEKRPAMARAADGNLHAAWMTDNRDYNEMIPKNAEIYSADLGKATSAPDYSAGNFQPYVDPFAEAVPIHPYEVENLKTIRAHTIDAGSKKFKIYRGDMHRHTDVSTDFKYDGSLIEVYRYAIDVAGFDYIVPTDHQLGFDQEFTWWQDEKLTDLFHAAGTFTPMFGYERSLTFPNGHRNVIFAKRGTRPLPIPRDEARGEARAEKLYAYLHENDGISMPHSSGTAQGTDWFNNDPEVEPLMEIFQGYRASYEYMGAPLAASPQKLREQRSGFNSIGYWWDALRKGYKIGVQASSDHWSTHISYAMILAEDFTRESMFAALKARHAYGATDNIVLDFQATDENGNSYIMGDIINSREAPRLKIKAIGTDKIKQFVIVKNEGIFYTRHPNADEYSLQFTDKDFVPGSNYYYIRVVQNDGQVAWSSPIWVE